MNFFRRVLIGVLVVAAGSAWGEPGPGEKLHVAGCENVFHAGAGVYSGGEPVTEEAFAALESLGIKTVISVDGATPKVELARAHGIRYVHLPLGYSEVNEERALELSRALRDLEQPIYVHCHHGKHRGPAAVAAGLIGSGVWSREQGVAFMHQAGTSEKYAGLFNSVAKMTVPTEETLDEVSLDFPEVADRSGMVESMAEIDRVFDQLALSAAADFGEVADHPDIDAKHDALQLYELFRELNRTHKAADWPGGMMQRMQESEGLAQQAEILIREGKPGAKDYLTELRRRCSSCHERFRDKTGQRLRVPARPE